ncbi:MAG: hypothetical protein ACQEWW_02545 [Bacillota bacterium]
MRNTKKFIILMTILPWLSVPFIGVKSLRRFLPGTIFMCVYLTAEGYLAEKKKWWWFPYNVKPNVLGEMPLILGPFLVGALWILKFTFGKFKLYLIVNIMIDSIFTFIATDWLKKIGYVSLVRITKYQLALLFLVKTFLMYGFQFIFESYFTRQQPALTQNN